MFEQHRLAALQREVAEGLDGRPACVTNKDLRLVRQVLDATALAPAFGRVMHGSSSVPQEWLAIIRRLGGEIRETWGVPIEEIRRGHEHGVRKIDIDTDLRLAMTGAMRQALAEHPSEFEPRKALAAARSAARSICELRFEACGCAGQTPRIRPLPPDVMIRRYA